MRITINGTPKNFNTTANLSEIIAQFCKQPKNIISEVNGAIVPCGQWQQTALKDGDTVELVSFVGGG